MYFSWASLFFFFFFFPDGTEEVVALPTLLPTLTEGKGYNIKC